MKPKFLLRMAIKSVAPDGSFEGSLAVYNNTDLGGDKILPGAFTKTIKDHGNEVPMLWQHKPDVPIGMLTLIDGPDALRVRGQLLMDLPAAKNAYLLIKARIVRGLSIGFDSVKDSVEDGVRLLKEIRLWEGSIVTFPMNEAAIITSVKARREAKADFDTEFAEIQLQDAMYQMWIALRSALSSIPWSEMERDEKIAASAASIEQFTAAYMEFIPAYIDWLADEYGDFTLMGKTPAESKAAKTNPVSESHKKKLRKARGFMDASAKCMADAAEQHKSADDVLAALIDPGAVDADDDISDDTPEEKAAAAPGPEPAKIDHSAADKHLVNSIRSLIPLA